MDAVRGLWQRLEADARDDVALDELLRMVHGGASRALRDQLAALADRGDTDPSNHALVLFRAVMRGDITTVHVLARGGFAPAIIESVGYEMRPHHVAETTWWWLQPLCTVATGSASRIWRAAARECVLKASRVPFVHEIDGALLRAVLEAGVRDDDVPAMCASALEDAYASCDFEPAISALLRLWHERASTHALVELCILGYRLENGGAIPLYPTRRRGGRRADLTRAAFVALKRRGGELVAHAHLLASATGCLLDYDAPSSDDQLLCGPISRSVVDIMLAEDEIEDMRRRRPLLIRAAYASGKYLDDIALIWVKSGLANSHANAINVLAMAGAYEPALNHVLHMRLSAREAIEVARGIRVAMDPSSAEYSAAVVLTLMHAPRSYADVATLDLDARRVMAHMHTCPVQWGNLFAFTRLFVRALTMRDVPSATIYRMLRMTGDRMVFVPAVRTRARALLEASEFVQPACVVCFEADKAESITLMPCKHRCVCLQCALEVDACPLCRGPVEAMRIWLADDV